MTALCDRVFNCLRLRRYGDIVYRLRLDAKGPRIHEDNYRKDAAEAADEIERLRTLVRDRCPWERDLPKPTEGG